MPDATLGHFLFSHLASLGVRHVFGIPGDYVLPLFRALEETEGIAAVVATHEPHAAFSADAYGRQTGLGVLLVTYGVGGFNAMNGVAGAYAERSPLLVVSGGPPTTSIHGGDPLRPRHHHLVKSATSQMDAYRSVTTQVVRLSDPKEAPDQIRSAAARAMEDCLPVYLEVPTDLMDAVIAPGATPPTPRWDPAPLEQATAHFAARLAAASRPVLLIGEEVARFGLQDAVRRLMATRTIPAFTTILGKGALAETSPGVLGVYAGVLSPSPAARATVETSDLVVMLGSQVTDVNCGVFTADLDPERLLIAGCDWVGDGAARLEGPISFPRFVEALVSRVPAGEPRGWPDPPRPGTGDGLMDRCMAAIDQGLGPDDVLVTDTGDSTFGSLVVRPRRDQGYLASSFYNTMGFAVPAALGAALAEPGTRPVVLVGDGAFQMTGMEISNLVRHRIGSTVVLFNNDGFGMQRIFVDGPFNDLARWDYSKVPELVGGGGYFRVDSSEALLLALEAARRRTDGPTLVEVVLPRGELSTGLRTMQKAVLRDRTGVCPLRTEGAEVCGHESSCAFCRATIWKK
ncbi:MAG: thiamine pyrophosphate-binding protein [Pseudomonadota bacterium]